MMQDMLVEALSIPASLGQHCITLRKLIHRKWQVPSRSSSQLCPGLILNLRWREVLPPIGTALWQAALDLFAEHNRKEEPSSVPHPMSNCLP